MQNRKKIDALRKRMFEIVDEYQSIKDQLEADKFEIFAGENRLENLQAPKVLLQKSKIEQRLNECEQRFHNLVDILPQTVFETDKNGIFKFINSYVVKEFGYQPNEVIGNLHFADIIIPEERESVLEELQKQSLEKGRGKQITFMRKDSTPFAALVNFSFQYREGTFQGFSGILTNIQEQIDIEERLRQNEENYRTIFELATDSIYIHDPYSGEIIDANQNAIKSYGLETLEELKEYGICIESPYSEKEVKKWLRKVREYGPQVFEWLNRRIDCTLFWEEVHLNYVNINGFDRVISICRDITVRKNVEEKLYRINRELKKRNKEYLNLNKQFAKQNKELLAAKGKAEESDRLKSAFLANMSHEIRTPMNAIMGFSGLLAKTDLSKDKQKHYAEIIRKRSKDLLKIIDDILDISKIEANQLVIQETVGDIGQLLDELLDFSLSKAEIDGKTKIRFSLTNQLLSNGSVYVDFGRLKQVLFNLVDNALKFTDEGSIEIGCKPYRKNKLLLYVKDTGIGIAKELQEYIFDRFRQAHSKDNDLIAGTGLGLAITKGIVELMGGKIWVESNINKGSTFYFTIRYKTGEAYQVQNQERSKACSLDGVPILIIEDDEHNALYLDDILCQKGAITLIGYNGQGALELIKLNPGIKLVLLDIMLPDFNGLELIGLIKKINPSVQIIIQSAFATVEDKVLGFKAGCDAYITKPAEENVIIETICKTLLRVY